MVDYEDQPDEMEVKLNCERQYQVVCRHPLRVHFEIENICEISADESSRAGVDSPYAM